MDNLNTSPKKGSTGDKPTPSVFTFVPLVWELPAEKISLEEAKPGALLENPNQSFTVFQEESMSHGEVFKAEKVFIRDCEEGGAGRAKQAGTKAQLNLSADPLSCQSPVCAENKPHRAPAGTASMETGVYKHRGLSQQQWNHTSGLSEVSSGYFANRVSEDRVSPTNSADLFPTPASSRESILSEGSDRDKSWSAVPLSSVTSPASLSRTVSPCSSVLSGIFSPAVVQIKRHFLAPGSSLLQTPYSSCESLSSSVCPQSPPPPPRHRPPLTRLSLLTAILRKGRLPVLSPSLQRPYTPCWPVNPVTLSFCKACSAASSVASIPLEFSSRFSSSASIDSQSHVHREVNKSITSPPPVQTHELSRTPDFQNQVKKNTEKIQSKGGPSWEEVISPAAEKSRTLPRAPRFYSHFKSAPPPKREETGSPASLKPQHTNISFSPELKPRNIHTNPRGHEDNNLTHAVTSSAPKPINKQESSAPHRRTFQPNPNLSKLQSLSQQLRSPPVRLSPPPPPLHPSRSSGINRSDTASPLAPSRSPDAAGRYASGESCPTSKTAKINTSHCLLSPSRYTPITFPGWPSPTNTPTPTPSPAPPVKSFTPSPSVSLRSTPSPRPGSVISDCSDTEGKKRKTHKIKQSYKSLAAIPTNTLLLDQQVIDEQVERGQSPYDTLDGGLSDTHAEMCSPSQLRQQSAELYAAIDEILANAVPPSKTSQSPQPSRSSTNAGPQQSSSSLLKSLGRETKYASLSSLNPSSGVTRKTKPGVIRPMTAIPRLTVEDSEEFHPNPFRHREFRPTSADNRKVANKSRSQPRIDFSTAERRTPFSACHLQISEPEDQVKHQVKEAATSFSTSEGRMNPYETHI